MNFEVFGIGTFQSGSIIWGGFFALLNLETTFMFKERINEYRLSDYISPGCLAGVKPEVFDKTLF